jgi:hypothetical protein
MLKRDDPEAKPDVGVRSRDADSAPLSASEQRVSERKTGVLREHPIERHCCIEPSRDTGAARCSPELRQRAEDRAHRGALVVKRVDLGPAGDVSQEDLPSQDHLNAQRNSADRTIKEVARSRRPGAHRTLIRRSAA